MKLSVVVVNYNVKYFLELCLNSLYRAVGGFEMEVFVVDNASTDGSVEYLKERFPQVHFIANTDNVGFSKANNQAIRLSKGEYVLLLNPDVVIGENVLDGCVQFMDTHPLAGGIGVKMVNGTGTFLPESKRGFPTPITSFFYMSGISRLFPKSRFLGKYHLRYLNEDEIHQVDVLSGAFMMMRKSALDKCGLLDEDFFMYGEDIDLSYRLTEVGFNNYYLPLPIIHYKGESTKKDSFRYVNVFYKAMIIFFRKHYASYQVLFAFIIRMGIFCRALIALLRRIPSLCYSMRGDKIETNVFLVLGDNSFCDEISALCKRNGIKGVFRIMKKEELMLLKNFSSVLPSEQTITHVVFDYDACSFQKIINILSSSVSVRVELGLYSKKSGVLVIPQKCYK